MHGIVLKRIKALVTIALTGGYRLRAKIDKPICGMKVARTKPLKDPIERKCSHFFSGHAAGDIS